MVVIFLSPVIHYLTIGIDKVGTHRSELGEKGKSSRSQNIVFSTFMTLWHISTTLMIMGFLVWYFWQCFLMTPSHQSGQRKNHCKENIPQAEYYFLCEDILYSMCIHKKKAMKAGPEYNVKGFSLINRMTLLIYSYVAWPISQFSANFANKSNSLLRLR